MPGRIDLEFTLGTSSRARQQARPLGERLRILVIGDFSGRGSRGTVDAEGLASRPILRLDIDNFDATLRALAPSLSGLDAAAGETLAFESLDDFHPDRLLGRVTAFRQLQAVAADDQGPLLERLIGGAPTQSATPAPATGSVVDNLIRRIVQPHVQSGPTAASLAAGSALDAARAALLQSVLHAPQFQRLEANWRGARRFVEGVELGDEVELHLLDATQAELEADRKAAGGDPAASALCRRLTQARLVGIERPWALIVGLYRLAASTTDLVLLHHLGAVAAEAGGPILLDAEPALAGCESPSDRTDWHQLAIADEAVREGFAALRRSAVSAWIGLALPRILLRLPYGRRTDAIETFAFDEAGAAHAHDALLWGSAALACAQCIAQAFIEQGDALELAGAFDVEDLPAYVREQDGEKRLQACAERYLPVQAGESLLQRGFIPLLSHGNRAAARVVGLQSIAEPRRGLAGLG